MNSPEVNAKHFNTSQGAIGKARDYRSLPVASILDHVKIARPDHWFKNVFVLPGIFLALLVNQKIPNLTELIRILYGLLIVCLTASSNYIINEITDAKFDKLHPIKKHRPIPSGSVRISIAYLEWILLLTISIFLSWTINLHFAVMTLVFLSQGIVYNVPPVRSKDVAYVDVLTESVNNPIRLLLGWFLVDLSSIPTLSLVAAYWMVGAFFMTSKRYSEFIMFNDRKKAGAYRNSFKKYNSERLLMIMFFYGSLFSFFMGIFLIRYRTELLLSIPFIALVISYYLKISLRPDSLVQNPEKLYKHRQFVLLVSISVLVITVLFLIDIPFLRELFSPVAAYYP